jgi:hypothetical protein
MRLGAVECEYVYVYIVLACAEEGRECSYIVNSVQGWRERRVARHFFFCVVALPNSLPSSFLSPKFTDPAFCHVGSLPSKQRSVLR